MALVEVDISMSVDGFITGPETDEYPGLGRGEEILHAWFQRDPHGQPFTFVTEGIESAIARARAAAGDKTVHVMGGASVIQQALNAGLVDSLHLHVAPIVLGAGTRLFDNLTEPIELERTEVVESQFGTHLRFRVVK